MLCAIVRLGAVVSLSAALLSTVVPAAAAEPPATVNADGGRYFGPLRAGKAEGNGRIEWANGARYQGGFHRGLFSGKGRYVYATGDVYEGGFANGMRSGKGHFAFVTGSFYDGEFAADLFDGHGRIENPDGMSYEGVYKRGYLEGAGKTVGPNGTYTGEFKRGEFEGEGEYVYPDGRKYRGHFVHGNFQGKGRFDSMSGGLYEGDFEKGEFTGNGVRVASGGARYEGAFVNWRANGAGKLIDGFGNIYEGQFKDDIPTGTARILYKDGSVYEGELAGWRPNGHGELRKANGDVYVGQFSYGLYEGEGTLTYATARPDGKTQDSGVWRYGRLKDRFEADERRTRANLETALYNQPRLLDDALRKLAPRSGRSINMFFLAVAGEGSQEVFRREVEFVRAQFDADFATRGHSLALVNSRTTVETVPMASVTSIRRAIEAIAARMDKQRDILFLFVTSHGSREHEISLGLDGMELPGLNPHEFASLLKESGIRWKVVVLSACYAGGFVDDLKDPGTLVLAAARRDRRSFGCADENDFTYFGRAYFKEALPQSDSFQDAFARASQIIGEWEERDAKKSQPADADEAKEAADEHSLPQIESPPPILEHLQQWWAQLPPRPRKSVATQ